jgi:hypothetical protein
MKTITNQLNYFLRGELLNKVTSKVLMFTPVVSKPNPPTVEVLGSGLLLEIDEDIFLITAGHLLNLEDWKSLLIPGNETKIIYLKGTIATSFDKPNLDSKIDFAVLKFSERMKKHLIGGEYQFLTPNRVIINHQVKYNDRDDHYVIAGHPVNSVKKVAGKRAFRLNPLKILTYPIAEKTYKKHGFNLEHHLLVKYQRKLKPFDFIHTRQTVEAGGISGSGLWYVPNWEKKEDDVPIFYLVGIMIENYKDYGFMVALRIDFVCETIRQVFDKGYLNASKIDVSGAIPTLFCSEMP